MKFRIAAGYQRCPPLYRVVSDVRYHWDGDILTIVSTSSVMGGADLGRPLLGGSARVPPGKRAQMQNLLAKSPCGPA
jgi:hypothetical protein